MCLFLPSGVTEEGSPAAVPRASARRPIRIVRRDDLRVVCTDDAASREQRYGAVVQRFPGRVGDRAIDAFVVALAVASIVEIFAVDTVTHRGVAVLLAALWSLPYLARRVNPVAPPFLAAAALALLAIVEGAATIDMSMPFLAALVTSVAFGLLPDPRTRITGWLAIVGAAAVVDYRSTSTVGDFFFTTLIMSLAWGFGYTLASRAAQARELRERVARVERDRSAAAERAASEERTRIARELHDVVAHSISVMVVQTSGVRRLLHPEQEREREALLSVERIGREALAEMRRMLGVMRTGEEQPPALAPQPGLQGLDRLVAQIEEAGLPVTLRVEGDRRELSPGVDLSAYRIVQEGLTNALKHARGAHAEVVVRYVDGAVEVEVADDGPGANGSVLDGHGLVGMRERVAVYGGTLEAGPRDGGGFVLPAEAPA
jgi:signal transduction histidine kinase